MAITRAVVPTACHQTEILFKYLSKCTPNVLMRPCAESTAAYTPMFVLAVPTKSVLKVARVEMKVAQAKLV